MIGRKRVLVLTAVTVLAAVALPVLAKEEGDPGQGKGRRRPDGPKPPDRERFMAHMAAMDKNGDGQVSFDEFVEARTKMMKENFARMDTNGDGVLSKEDRREPPRGEGEGEGRWRRGEGEGRGPRKGGAEGEQAPAVADEE